MEVLSEARLNVPRCPLCFMSLFENQEFVVCPVCDANQHSMCVDELGECHGTPPQQGQRSARAPSPPTRGHPLRRYRRRRTRRQRLRDEQSTERLPVVSRRRSRQHDHQQAPVADAAPGATPEHAKPRLAALRTLAFWTTVAASFLASLVLSALEHRAAIAPALLCISGYGTLGLGSVLFRSLRTRSFGINAYSRWREYTLQENPTAYTLHVGVLACTVLFSLATALGSAYLLWTALA